MYECVSVKISERSLVAREYILVRNAVDIFQNIRHTLFGYTAQPVPCLHRTKYPRQFFPFIPGNIYFSNRVCVFLVFWGEMKVGLKGSNSIVWSEKYMQTRFPCMFLNQEKQMSELRGCIFLLISHPSQQQL